MIAYRCETEDAGGR